MDFSDGLGFKKGMNLVQIEAYQTAKDHKFYDRFRSDGEAIALMHSELSECLEAMRRGNPADEHCPSFSNAEVELADCIIRIADFAEHSGFDLGGAIIEKMRFNKTRPPKHNKKF